MCEDRDIDKEVKEDQHRDEVAELRKKAQRWDWFMEWWEGFKKGVDEIPYQAENPARGSSVYNWHNAFRFELQGLLRDMDAKERETS